MSHDGARSARWSRGLAAACVILLPALGSAVPPAAPGVPSLRPGDPWTATQLIGADELAATLRRGGKAQPLLLHVGFQVLYRSGAIPGSVYAGPGRSPEGLAALKKAVSKVPRDRAIVVYCGCCPWDHCPNMVPAFRVLREMGFTNLRALHVADNLQADWGDRGYPLEKPRR